MRHRKVFGKLGRSGASRKHLFSKQVQSLIEFDRIRTTLAKAKELRRIADRAVTMAKTNSKQSRLRATRFVKRPDLLAKLFTVMAERYKTRQGGYTRVLRCGFREGDRADMAIIEFVDSEDELKAALERYKKVEEQIVTYPRLAALLSKFEDLHMEDGK